jgi:hypothetical protein
LIAGSASVLLVGFPHQTSIGRAVDPLVVVEIINSGGQTQNVTATIKTTKAATSTTTKSCHHGHHHYQQQYDACSRWYLSECLSECHKHRRTGVVGLCRRESKEIQIAKSGNSDGRQKGPNTVGKATTICTSDHSYRAILPGPSKERLENQSSHEREKANNDDGDDDDDTAATDDTIDDDTIDTLSACLPMVRRLLPELCLGTNRSINLWAFRST